MKILHVISTIDPQGGGPPLVIVRIAAAQAALGHSVTVLSYSHADEEVRVARSMQKVPGVQRVNFESLGARGRLEAAFAIKAKKRLEDLISGTDWVHCHGVWERILYFAAKIAYASGVPYCFRPAGMLDPWSLGQKKLKKRIALKLGYRQVLSRAAFIHALNRDEARLIEPLGLSVPAEIVPNGIFSEEIKPLPDDGSFRRNWPDIGMSPYILFLARLHVKKGLDYLLDAFDLVARTDPSVMLVIAGPDDGAGDWLRERCAMDEFRERIHMVGALYGDDKFSALVDSSVFCLPSRQEGFSVAALEALACGIPVVISQASNFPEIADAGAGFVVDLEASEIAAALLRVLNDAELRQKMSYAAENLVREHYLWPQIASSLIERYQKYAKMNRGAK